MSDFIWTQESREGTISRFKKLYDNNMIQPAEKLLIFGTDGTYTHIRKGEDFVAILGYCYFPKESIQNTISRILDTFNESTIAELKKQLVGQFIMIIKKDSSIYIFADFWHVRNIFYSKDFKVISSSFSVIEDILGTSVNDLDLNKVVEYVAMRHIFWYPSWVGDKTMHKNIRFLKPFEYLVVDNANLTCRIGDLRYFIDNSKELDINKISSRLLATLKTHIENPRLKEEKIGVTLTGGYDSRLIAAIAANYYKKASFRLALSPQTPGSIQDSKIAQKIAKLCNVPIEICSDELDNLDDQFYVLTEGMSPVENSVITPIIERTGEYALGLGGCFGTELFMPIAKYARIEEYIEAAISAAQKDIPVSEKVWERLRHSLLNEFDDIRKHYILSISNPTDEVRIFQLLSTTFFSSFLLSAYNITGLQLEPYGHFDILEIALKVPAEHFGSKESFRGTNIVQKMAMAKESPRIGKIMTTHCQTLVPLSVLSFPSYLLCYLQHKLIKLTARMRARNNHHKQIIIKDVCYLSDGWDELFLRRIREKYGVNVAIHYGKYE